MIESVAELRAERRLMPVGARWVGYRLDEPPPQSASRGLAVAAPTLAVLRVTGASRPSVHESVSMGELLRSAVQRRFDRERDGSRSPTLSGHGGAGARRDQHRHAHYLAVPDRDGRRIDHLVVWAPEGLGAHEVRAVAELERLTLRAAPEPLRVALAALGDHRGIDSLPRLLGPARVWSSVTPFALPRHPKRRGGQVIDGVEDQLQRELAHRGIDAAVEISPLRRDWSSYRRRRSGGSRRDAPRGYGLRLRFAEPQRGPIVLGALSHFGLGLFLADERA